MEEFLEVPEFKFKGRPMTVEESKMFVRIALSNVPERPLGETGMEELENQFLCQVLKKRLEAYKLPFKITDKFLISSMLTFVKTPSTIMILLRLCWQHYLLHRKTLFDFNIWSTEMFPWGVPTEEELEKMWDSQKAENQPLGNMLDNPVAWKEKFTERKII